jgi:hypothetical protein
MFEYSVTPHKMRSAVINWLFKNPVRLVITINKVQNVLVFFEGEIQIARKAKLGCHTNLLVSL